MIRRSPLKRSSKPIPKKRARPRRGKESQEQRTKVRDNVYTRCGGMCELRLRPDCLVGPIQKNGNTPWDHWHAAHIKSEGSGGKYTEDNLLGACWKCHLLGLHRGEVSPSDKPVPAKNLELDSDWTKRYDNY